MKQSKRTTSKAKQRVSSRAPVYIALAFLACVVIGGTVLWLNRSTRRTSTGHSRGELTFSRDIAPVIFQNCSECHRPGQSAPFSLLSYGDVKKHATDIADVTSRRYMPPWLPENPPGELADQRRLTAEQIAMVQQWVAEGAKEGNTNDLPPLPHWSGEWTLGQPDLVVTMPEPYTLPAEGKDVYRNFILAPGLDQPRYVRAVEFRPGSKVVHHAFVRFDRTGQCRELDARDPEPGFGGMETPPTAETPPGHFSGWVPGARPAVAPPGLAWQLPARADLVVLLHMQCSGKPERVQPTVGLYFTDKPPTNIAAIVNLQSYAIDIPAGDSNYVVEESITLPAAADLLAIKPHAHFLGRRLEGLATLPNGSTRTLLAIPQWDFNWQTDYRFTQPVSVPAGTQLRLRFTYDNSTNNARNPHHPPIRVQYGLQSWDEMAELAFQMLPQRREDLPAFQQMAQRYGTGKAIERNQRRLRLDPSDSEAASDLGKLLFSVGDVAGSEAALSRALALRPESPDYHFSMGVLRLDQNQLSEAEQQFSEAVRLAPDHFKARSNLGLTYMRSGKLDLAEQTFREVLRRRPDDTFARNNLDLLLQQKTSR